MVGHPYTQPGVYTAKLTVTDKDGAQSVDTAAVEVNKVNQPPVANIVAPTTATVGDPLSFNGSGSKDSDGSIVSYVWNFGDGSTANGATATHSYGQAGTYQVSLTVTDNGGLTATANHSVEVSKAANQPPSASIAGPDTAQVGQTIDLTGKDSADPDGSIVEFRWDFGDGSTERGVNVSHSYQNAGTYQITLTVTDDGGLTATATHPVQVAQVANEPPVASIIGPVAAQVGQPVDLTGKDSVDPDGGIVEFRWDFGDGITERGKRVSHVYETTGSYQITLTVTDNEGATGVAHHMIEVGGPVKEPPIAMINAPEIGQVGQEVGFDGAASTDNDGKIETYAWDLGDNTIAGGVSITHTYSLTGIYTVTLTVTDNDGLTTQAARVIQIEPAPAITTPAANQLS